MSKVKAHPIIQFSADSPGIDSGAIIAYVHPASWDSVFTVLGSDMDDPDGRSEWLWVRLINGDLVLGIFPQGDTYSACEVDAEYKEG